MKKNFGRIICFVLILIAANVGNIYSQAITLNSVEKSLVKSWRVYLTQYEGETEPVSVDEASVFTFSADHRWKKEVFNPKVIYNGSWKVDTAKMKLSMTWEEIFDDNTYQYNIKKLSDAELDIEPINSNSETMFMRPKE